MKLATVGYRRKRSPRRTTTGNLKTGQISSIFFVQPKAADGMLISEKDTAEYLVLLQQQAGGAGHNSFLPLAAMLFGYDYP
jgi:hypothetical protein